MILPRPGSSPLSYTGLAPRWLPAALALAPWPLWWIILSNAPGDSDPLLVLPEERIALHLSLLLGSALIAALMLLLSQRLQPPRGWALAIAGGWLAALLSLLLLTVVDTASLIALDQLLRQTWRPPWSLSTALAPALLCYLWGLLYLRLQRAAPARERGFDLAALALLVAVSAPCAGGWARAQPCAVPTLCSGVLLCLRPGRGDRRWVWETDVTRGQLATLALVLTGIAIAALPLCWQAPPPYGSSHSLWAYTLEGHRLVHSYPLLFVVGGAALTESAMALHLLLWAARIGRAPSGVIEEVREAALLLRLPGRAEPAVITSTAAWPPAPRSGEALLVLGLDAPPAAADGPYRAAVPTWIALALLRGPRLALVLELLLRALCWATWATLTLSLASTGL